MCAFVFAQAFCRFSYAVGQWLNFQMKDVLNMDAFRFYIGKTCPCNVYPLEPQFYIAKLGYAGVYLFFLFLLQNIDCGYSLEPPRRGGSNMYPQSLFRAKIRKYQKFSTEFFHFLQFKKFLYITWACLRNEKSFLWYM